MCPSGPQAPRAETGAVPTYLASAMCRPQASPCTDEGCRLGDPYCSPFSPSSFHPRRAAHLVGQGPRRNTGQSGSKRGNFWRHHNSWETFPPRQHRTRTVRAGAVLPSLASRSPVRLRTLLCRWDCHPAPDQVGHMEHARVTPQLHKEYVWTAPHSPWHISPWGHSTPLPGPHGHPGLSSSSRGPSCPH